MGNSRRPFVYLLTDLGRLGTDATKGHFSAAVLWFALVWANVPFARLFTVVMRGGNEGVITRALVGQTKLTVGVWLIEILVILVVVVPAFARAWQLLAVQQRLWIFISFLIGPMLIEFISMHKIGNLLLAKGVLAQQGILGSPLLVNSWNGTWLVLLVLCLKPC